MADKAYPESNVISEIVSNHKPPDTIESLYKEVTKNFEQTRKITTVDHEHKKGTTEMIVCFW